MKLSKRSASREATRWFLRLHAPDCLPAEKEAFNVWLASDPVHHQEYESVRLLWDRMHVLETKPMPEFKAIFEQSTPLPRWRSVAYLQVTLAVALVMLVGMGGAWWWSMNRVTVTAYQTAQGELQTVTLSDGTVMDINTATSLSVRMSQRERRIVLERGEAYFAVAPEAERPFIVAAKGGQIRDIGTQFSVYTQETRVLVAVEEGSVLIDLDAGTGNAREDPSRHLNAGERIAYTPTGRWSNPEPVAPDVLAPWRRGQLVFDGVPLNEAMLEIQRYWPGEIILADAGLGDTEVRGVIDIKDLAGFFQSLPEILPVKVIHDTAGRMILSRS